ncbi:MAG: glycosyltransferase family 4 protein [Actinobacteria bacterium]|nr:MAG: glycosyltransferase family 4 protein [Actinomycetota bacterium]
MRIAILSPVWFAVPPSGYGGIEWVVSLLADGLADAGHDVTLFASGDSHSKARLSYVFELAPSEQIGKSLPELRHALACFDRAGDFDVINDHSGPLSIALGDLVETPVLHTVHGPLDGDPGRVYEGLAQLAPGVGLISISLNQRQDPKEHRYFHELVEPHLVEGIEYLGEVSHGEKVELLQNARATLFPIEWEEPFGLVMIESMACGTPVIATRHGAVPEVIEDGASGIVVGNYREMPAALDRADVLDPLECRRYVEERYAPERMVEDYLRVYEAAVARASASV